ncbi:MAG: hypothetical protein ACUVUQ_06445 [Thermodesulfovibrionales bacterium]
MKKDNEEKTMKKDVDLSRRKFLIGGAGALVGGAIAGSISGALIKPGTAHATLPAYLPKPPYTKPIDTTAVRALAYRHYLLNGG